jgi:hypothetical protein
VSSRFNFRSATVSPTSATGTGTGADALARDAKGGVGSSSPVPSAFLSAVPTCRNSSKTTLTLGLSLGGATQKHAGALSPE